MIGDRLKELLIKEGDGADELAAKVGVPTAVVYDWINDYEIPEVDELIAICIAYRVSADYLLGLSGYKKLRQERLS